MQQANCSRLYLLQCSETNTGRVILFHKSVQGHKDKNSRMCVRSLHNRKHTTKIVMYLVTKWTNALKYS
jgi:hypothetical protein